MNSKALGSVNLDSEGYLVDPEDWTEAVAVDFAEREGIELTSDHWRVIRFMREWLDEHGVTADARHVMKFLAPNGDRDTGRALLFQLFPFGYVKQACRIAGMKRPRAWSTG